MVPFLYLQHQLVRAAEVVKLRSLRRLLGNDWNIHKLQSMQGWWSWPETTSKQKKTLRVIFKLTTPSGREMIRSLLPFYHTCPWLKQKKGSQDAAVLTMIWTQRRCSTPVAWITLKHSDSHRKLIPDLRVDSGLRLNILGFCMFNPPKLEQVITGNSAIQR